MPLHHGSPEAHRAVRRVRALARLLDTAIPVPGTRFRFGLDPILGLLPGIGDAVAMGVAAYILIEARRLGVPPRIMSRMLFNALADMVVGAVPIAGDLFDAAFHSNARNARLLEAWLAELRAAEAADRPPPSQPPPPPPPHG